ncbi:MAG: thioredoxin domain-containing protein, partial [Rickettsia endosymbiont of Ixodes persulcatus]|nr:thioredoxin domain-containing protein [Rickettsia endosymbiont of Ixodes persulcatus]
MANNVTDSSFEKEVLESDLPVLVDFLAEWCGPCKMLTPIIDEISKELQGKVKVVKMNIDE